MIRGTRGIKSKLSVLACLLGSGAALLSVNAQTAPVQIANGGLNGAGGNAYISSRFSDALPGYGYGMSFYSLVWPLLPLPLDRFQIGAAGTWILPDNRGYSGVRDLCPPGSPGAQIAGVNGDHSGLFQTIEGGNGFRAGDKFRAPMPKYRPNSTPSCYSYEVSSTGWGFSGAVLPEERMGVAQLSNRLLVPPDGIQTMPGPGHQFLGISWMALPLNGFSQEPAGLYTLTSASQSPRGRCLTGNTPTLPAFSGAAYMVTCTSSPSELWKFQPVGDGFFRLQNQATESSNMCLDGNTGVTPVVHNSWLYLAPCNGSADQLWTLTPAGTSYQLQTQRSKTLNRCVESAEPDNGGGARMNPCSTATGQIWLAAPATPANPSLTDPNSWTLFLNTLNFKGPVVYFIPEHWRVPAASRPASTGRGLDARPADFTAGAMEFNTVPFFAAQDSGGTVYSKVPRLQFPVDSTGATTLMQDITFYSPGALFSPTGSWLRGGAPLPAGVFDQQYAQKALNCGVAPVSFFQSESGANPAVRLALSGMDQFVQTKLHDAANCRWGLQWTGRQEMTSDGMARFPEYFRQSGNTRSPVLESAVPDSTRLKEAAFREAVAAAPYTTPTTQGTAWTSPGPSRGPFSAVLSDGSIVNYSWYRFVDQPTLQHLNLSPTAKADLQRNAELIHRNWTNDRTYQAPPSSGSVVSVDPALLLTPPEGLEFGYVPIATSQGRPAITSVTNAAAGTGIAANTFISIFGTGLAPASSARVWTGTDFSNNQLPSQLDGVSASVNGKPAYVYFVSSTQINVLTPPDTISGTVPVQVTVSGARSNVFNVAAQSNAPAFFTFDGTHVAATHADGSLLGPESLYPGLTTPAKPGETVLLYGNGFGPTTEPVVNGSVTQSGTLSPLPVVRIGPAQSGVRAVVQFAGLVAVGQYQFNVVVPAGLADGDHMITATLAGRSTQAQTRINVRN